jgi:6-phosphogluconolactonase (cycloisomerase 2 family)
MKGRIWFMFLSSLLLVVLGACGGGSSSTNNTGSGSNGGSNPPPGSAPAGSELFYLGDNAGRIHGYGLDPASGNLTPIAVNNMPTAADVGLAADSGGMVLYSTNVATGVPNVSSWIVDKHAGTLTANPGVQLPVPPRKLAAFSTYLYVTADPNAQTAKMWVFKIDPLNGALSLSSNTQLPGVPFGMTIDPSGSFVFILWDGIPGGKVSALSRNPTTGQVTDLHLAADTGGLAPGAVAVTPDGNFVVIVNQGSNNRGSNIAVLSLDASTGALTPVPGSPFPSGPQPGPMAIDPTGKFVLVADSGNNNLTPYTIDSTTGSLTAGTPASLGEQNSQPGVMAIDPSGKFVFVSIHNEQLAGISLDPDTGSVKPMPGSPFSANPQFDTTDMAFVPGVTH